MRESAPRLDDRAAESSPACALPPCFRPTNTVDSHTYPAAGACSSSRSIPPADAPVGGYRFLFFVAFSTLRALP